MKRLIMTAMTVIFVMCSGTLWAVEDNLEKSARNLESVIMGMLKGIDRTLTKSASVIGKMGISNLETKRVLKECRLGRSYVIDCAFVDDKGVIRVIEPDKYKNSEGIDISYQDAVKEILKTRKPVMSNLIDSVEGIKAVDFKAPVFSEKNEFLGSVSMLTRIEEMIKFAAVQVEAGRGVKTWVMQKDGLIIYETDHSQIGLNLFTSPFYKNYPELIELGKRMVKEESGEGSYTFLVKDKQKVVRKDAAWRTLSFYGNEWVLVVYQQEE
ncbi:MAG TPA: cache domain-containing protein [Desulfomonilia bacterium]